MPPPKAVLERRLCRWVGRGFEELLHEIHGLVQVVVVHRAHGEMQLPSELGAECFPVPPENVAEVVVLSPILGDRRVYVAGFRIPEGLGIAVGAQRAVHGLPHGPLSTRAVLGRDGLLVAVFVPNRVVDQPVDLTLCGAARSNPLELVVVRVRVLVDIDLHVLPKIDRVGCPRPASGEQVRVEDHHGGGFPPSRRPTGQHARPGLSDDSEFVFEIGNQLLGDGVSVGAHVGGIDRVGRVVERIRVPERDDDEFGRTT